MKSTDWLSEFVREGDQMKFAVETEVPADIGTHEIKFKVSLTDYPMVSREFAETVVIASCQVTELRKLAGTADLSESSYVVPLFTEFSLQMPLYEQVPSCGYPLSYLSDDSNLDEKTGNYMTELTDIELRDQYVTVDFTP